MDVAVIGPGALGCLFGGRLADAGHDVTLIHHRQEYVDRVTADGLKIESQVDGEPSLDIAVEATTDAASVGVVDLAIVFVKAHVTERALDQHGACIGSETAVLSLQNGLRHDAILREQVGTDRALAGTTYQGAILEAPGHITQTAAGPSTFGGENMAAARRVAEALNEAGLPAELTDDPERIIWEKQLLSIGIKPIAALTRLTNDRAVATPARRDLMRQLITEAVRVARARDVDLPDRDHAEGVIEICTGTDHYSSTLQDVWAERKTEIDEINGALLDMADEVGIDVPANRIATTLVRGLEESYS
ncbi:MAG: ketopantoate reductase family protein [Salinirussus sp.]